MKSYPGITPEVAIPLEGILEFWYKGSFFQTDNATLFSFLHAPILNNFQTSPRFVVITFKSNALASLLPFINIQPKELIKNPIVPAEMIFGMRFQKLCDKLKLINDKKKITNEIMDYFDGIFNPSKTGFVTEIVNEFGKNFNVNSILNHTNYSYSTIERKFKNETGLTPKKYLILKRFKACLALMIETKNSDWMSYVVRFGYYDQSHFIKEMKMFTGLSPSEIMNQNNFLDSRPNLNFLTNFYNEE